MISVFPPSYNNVLFHWYFLLILEIATITTGRWKSQQKSEEITSIFKFDVDSHQAIIRLEASFLDLNQILPRMPVPRINKSHQHLLKTLPKYSRLQKHTRRPQRLQGHDDFDSPTSTLSNRSAKAEHYTYTFANAFLGATLPSLKRLSDGTAWYNDEIHNLSLYFFLSPMPTNSKVRTSDADTTWLDPNWLPKSNRGLEVYLTIASSLISQFSA